MQLEDYFNFLAHNDIRIKETRIGIETVLYEYIYHARTAEEIAKTYSSLSLEQVYATILYYLHNQDIVTRYMATWIEHGDQMRASQRYNPPSYLEKLQKLRAEKTSQQPHDAQVSY
jgi:uncharacterized protein (DUF433 family)